MSNMPMDRGNNVAALARLPHLSDPQLTQIAQNTSDPLSTFAIAILNSKQIAAKKAQAGANQPTVAQQVLSKEQQQMGLGAINPQAQQAPQQAPQQMAQAPQPQQAPQQMAEGGVATLDTGDMYDENNYAGGGIVAFSGTNGSDVSLSDKYMAQSMQSDLDTPYTNPTYWWAKAHDLMSGNDQSTREWVAGKTAKRDKYLHKPALTAPELDEAVKQIPGQSFINPNQPQPQPQTDAQTQLPPGGFADLLKSPVSQFAPMDVTNPNASIASRAAAGDKDQEGSYDPTAVMNSLYKPIKDPRKEYEKLKQDETSVAKNSAETFRALLGKDTGAEEMKARLEKMEKKTAHDEDTAPWMALTQAGLAMAAGKSKFALQNIAEGGAAGLKAYTDAKDKIERAEEKQADIAYQLAKAKRAEDISAATHGLNSEQHIKDQNHAVGLAEIGATLQTNIANQKNIIDAYEAANKGNLYGAEAYAKRGEGDYYRMGKDSANKGVLTEDQIVKHFSEYQLGLGFKDIKKGLNLAQFASILRNSANKNANPDYVAPSTTSGQFVTDPKTGAIHYVPAQ